MSKTIEDYSRPTSSLLQKFEGVSAALLHEAMGQRGALASDFRKVTSGGGCVGAALTIKAAPGDNLMLHKAISLAQPGDILVANVDGFTDAGLWGEIATAAAMERGIRGLVTDGAVRDVDAVGEMGFAVFARGVSMKGTSKKKGGSLNLPIVIGGVYVQPGDIVVGDSDGVVVVPQAEAEEALDNADRIEKREAKILREIRSGKLTLDLLGLRPTLRDLGLEQD